MLNNQIQHKQSNTALWLARHERPYSMVAVTWGETSCRFDKSSH